MINLEKKSIYKERLEENIVNTWNHFLKIEKNSKFIIHLSFAIKKY